MITDFRSSKSVDSLLRLGYRSSLHGSVLVICILLLDYYNGIILVKSSHTSTIIPGLRLSIFPTRTMAAHTSTIDDNKVLLLKDFNTELNLEVLYALLHGLYTGIVAVALWNIYTSEYRYARKVMVCMVMVIISLYVLATIDFTLIWSIGHSAFAVNGKNLGAVFLTVNGSATATLVTGITAIVSVILADFTMIWRCWMVWGQRWAVVVFPIFFLLSGIGFKMIDVLQRFINATEYGLGVNLYSCLILATTLWCTFLIIYRIWMVTGHAHIRIYCRVTVVLVESSFLYSASLILYLGLFAHNSSNSALVYWDSVATFARGVAPTLLVGRIAAGHTLPDGSWSDASSTRNSTVGDICDLEAQTEKIGIGESSGIVGSE